MDVNVKTILLILILVIIGCKSTKLKLDDTCIIDVENNSIKGGRADTKTFSRDPIYLPCGIEELLSTRHCKFIERSNEVNNSLKEHFISYEISGCQDTSWAKRAMAEHLLNKYGMIRKDTTIYETIYKWEIVDSSKIITAPNGCEMIWDFGYHKSDDTLQYKKYTCVSGKSIFGYTIPPELTVDIFRIENSELLGNYSVIVPRDIYPKYGLEYYSENFLEPQGISMKVIGIDTIHTGSYNILK